MKKYNVGILGATGAVGQEMVKVLQERKFPVDNLRLFASSRSAGKEVKFNGESVFIEEAKEDSKLYEGLEIVLGALDNDLAKKMIPNVVKAGAVVIDNSSAYRLDDNVPLVVPEVNPDDTFKHKGINSHCASGMYCCNPFCTAVSALLA